MTRHVGPGLSSRSHPVRSHRIVLVETRLIEACHGWSDRVGQIGSSQVASGRVASGRG
jgi:hypothetical protein